MRLIDLIKVYDNVLSKETCNKIINEYEMRKGNVEHYDTDSYKFDLLNLNNTDLYPLAVAFIQQIKPLIVNYSEHLNVQNYIKMTAFEDVRIKKYLKNSDYQFKTHVDAIDKETSKRFLTFILYLNDNNGCTTFPSLGYSYKPRQGSVLIFSPLWMYPHSGDIPTDNDKYIMTSYLHFT